MRLPRTALPPPPTRLPIVTLTLDLSRFQGLGGLVKAAIVHHTTFEAKAGQFERSLLLVAQTAADDGQHHKVCGVIAVAIKRAWLHSAERDCGYVFDLRIAPSHQGRGLGKRLALEAEARCAERGVEVLYLSVNRRNAIARRLYKALGWTRASARKLYFRPLLLPPTAPPGLSATLLEPDKALELVASHYAARPLGLSRAEFARLFSSPLYLGTFECTDGARAHCGSMLLSSASPRHCCAADHGALRQRSCQGGGARAPLGGWSCARHVAEKTWRRARDLAACGDLSACPRAQARAAALRYRCGTAPTSPGSG